MKSVPLSNFAIVIDTEREMVVFAGSTGDCWYEQAWRNRERQSLYCIVRTLDGKTL